MTSLLYPDAGSRRAEDNTGRPAAGKTAVVYADSAGATLAEIYADSNGTPGALIADAELTTDSYGFLPLFWGPADGTDKLYVSVNAGPIWPVDADYSPRIDAIEAGGGGGSDGPGLAAHIAATTTVHGIANTALLETTAGAQAKVDAHNADTSSVHGIADTAALETGSGAQARVDAHAAETVAVHGIANTALLETQAGAQSKATAAQTAAQASSAQRAANLSDLGSVATARTNLGLGGAAVLDVGETAGTVAAGNDGRFADARTPTAHAASHGAAGSDPVAVTQAQVTGLTSTLAGKADLVGGVIPSSQMPDLAINATFPVESQAEMLALTASVGDVAVRIDQDPAPAYMLVDTDPAVLGNWRAIGLAGTVSSVNGQSGSVTLAAADVGAPPTSRTVSAGSYLSGGGDLTTNRIISANVGTTAGTLAAGDDARITSAVQPSRSIATTAPLAGGGDLSANRTLTVANATTSTVGVVQLAGDLTGTGTTPTIATAAVTTTKIADGNVTTAKIADGNITSAKIADGTIVDADINASAAIAQSKVSGLTAALDTKVAKSTLVFNVADYGSIGTSNDLTTIQAALTAAAAAAPATVMLKGAHTIAGMLTISTGVTLDGSQGTLTQTTSLTASIRVNNATGVTLRNLTMTGVGSDYVNTSSVYAAAAITLAGTSSDITIDGCTLTGHAGAGVYMAANIHRVTVRGCTIIGPGSPPIVDTTSNYGGGIVCIGPNNDVEITGNRISQYAQGVVTGEVSHVRIADNHIHDIVGQHGLYLEPVSDVTVADNLVTDVVLQGIKLQIGSTSWPDVTDITVTGNVVTNAGSHPVLITNPVGGSPRLRRIIVAANVLTSNGSGGDGININNLVGATITHNVINNVRAGIAISSSQQIAVTHNQIQTCIRQGISVADSPDVQIRDNRIIDPATGNEVANEYGIHATGVTTANLLVDGNTVSDAGANMRYGLYLSGIDQATAVVRDNRLTGATDYGARLDSATNVEEWTNNRAVGTLGDITGWPATFTVKGPPRQFVATAAPTSGTFLRGDVVWNSTPTASTALGWVATAAGTPGTWTSFGAPPAGGSVYAGPATNGLIGAPFDPALANVAMGAMTAGVLYLVKVDLTLGGIVSSIRVLVSVAGSGLTSGQCLLGVYSSAGARIGQTADQSTVWNSTGAKQASLTTPTSSQTAGTQVYVAILWNGTTSPQFRGLAATASFANDNLSAGTYRWATAGTGQTSLPSTLPTMAALTATPWVGLKS